MNDVLEKLEATIVARRGADPADSYVASLHAKGLNKILEKIGEEATEVVIAAKDAQDANSCEALVGEVADLWFHSIIMLSHLDIRLADVTDCLVNRFGVSGHEEKASRDT